MGKQKCSETDLLKRIERRQKLNMNIFKTVVTLAIVGWMMLNVYNVQAWVDSLSYNDVMESFEAIIGIGYCIAIAAVFVVGLGTTEDLD